MPEYLNTAKAAKLLNLSQRKVRRLCRNGKLIGSFQEYKGGPWQIPEDVVEQWLNQNKKDVEDKHGIDTSSSETSSTEDLSNTPGPPVWWQRFRYNPWIFYPTIVFGILITISGIVFGLISAGSDFGGARKQFEDWGILDAVDPAKDEEILVLITQFSGVGNYDPDARIYRNLYKAVQGAEIENVRVEQITAAPGLQKNAISLGERYGASIVIWGSFDEAAVEPRFEIIQSPDFKSLLPELEPTINTSFRSFNIYMARDLPANYEYFTFATLGQIYLFDKKNELAVNAFSNALEVNLSGREKEMSAFSVYELRGIAQMGMDDLEAALSDFQKSVEIEPNQFDTYNSLAVTYMLLERYQEAMTAIDKALEIDPVYWDSYKNRGLVYYYLKDYEKALEQINQSLKLYPGEYEMSEEMTRQIEAGIYSNRALVYDALKEYDQARSDYKKALELKDDEDGLIYHNLGHLETENSNPGLALEYFEKALSLGHEEPKTFQGRGVAHRQLGNYDQAMMDFNHVIEMAPEYGGGYYERGVLYQTYKDWDKALIDFNQTVEIWPDNIRTFQQRATTYFFLRQYENAIADYTTLIKLEPSNLENYSGRGWLYVETTQDFDFALLDFEYVLERNPQHVRSLLGRGVVKRRLFDDYRGAIQDFSAALKIDPEEIYAYLLRSETYAKMGDYQKSVEDCARFMQLKQGNKIFDEFEQCGVYVPEENIWVLPQVDATPIFDEKVQIK